MVDELRLWVNTNNINDIKYINELKEVYSSIITLEHHPQNVTNFDNSTIRHFWKNTVDKNTVYIRLDDDIVWMEKNYLENLYNFRVENPQYFLISGNVVNNALCDHIHQKNGVYPPNPHFGYHCMDENGWINPLLAEQKHLFLLHNIQNNNLKNYYFQKCELTEYQRFSINSVSWFGSDFAEFGGDVVGLDEESWVTEIKTKEINKKCCIYGGALCSHYSFFTQREYMDNTNCLEYYRKLIP